MLVHTYMPAYFSTFNRVSKAEVATTLTDTMALNNSGKKRQKFYNAGPSFDQNIRMTYSTNSNGSRKASAPTSVGRFALLLQDPACHISTRISRYGTAKQKHEDCESGKENSRIIMNTEMNKASTSNEFVVYEIEVTIFRQNCLVEKWILYRRYSAFKHLCTNLNRVGNDGVRLPRGARSSSNDKSHVFYSKRGLLLDAWLKEICLQWKENLLIDIDNEIALFLMSTEGALPCPSFSPYDCSNMIGIGIEKSPVVKYGKFYDIDVGMDLEEAGFSNKTPYKQKPLAETGTPMSITKSTGKSITRHQARSRCVPLDSYKMVSVIGKGSFGKVLIACRSSNTLDFCSPKKNNKNTDEPVAVKVLSIAEMITRKQAARVDVERQCLEKANSPFIVKLHGAYRTDTHLYFVQDYCAAGELYFHLERNGYFSNKLSRFYAAECILALEHLHSLGIVYRDLKPENIMLDASGHIKLVDFGLAKVGVHDAISGTKSFVGTTEYLSPEMIHKKGHGLAVDWWALGMVLYEMLAGLPPWYSEDKQEVMNGVLHSPLKFTSKISSQARNLLSGLLQRIPQRRLGSQRGAAEIKENPYFASINWAYLANKRIKPPFIPSLQDTCDTSYFDNSFTSLSIKIEEKVSKEEKNLIQQSLHLFQGFQYSSLS